MCEIILFLFAAVNLWGRTGHRTGQSHTESVRGGITITSDDIKFKLKTIQTGRNGRSSNSSRPWIYRVCGTGCRGVRERGRGANESPHTLLAYYGTTRRGGGVPLEPDSGAVSYSTLLTFVCKRVTNTRVFSWSNPSRKSRWMGRGYYWNGEGMCTQTT